MTLLNQVKKIRDFINVLLLLASAVRGYLDLLDRRRWLLLMLLGCPIVIRQDGVRGCRIFVIILKGVSQCLG
jgi:hypothetical protein